MNTYNKPRLFCKGVILGYKRSRANQYPSCSLLQIEGVKTKEDTQFYMGKRVAYIFKAKRSSKEKRFRVIWGRVRKSHGNSGVVRAKFTSNLPPMSFGAPCRVFLYPSNI